MSNRSVDHVDVIVYDRSLCFNPKTKNPLCFRGKLNEEHSQLAILLTNLQNSGLLVPEEAMAEALV